ncbi:MAG: response regulator [Candidatus Korobacteraceae bacterium]
MLALQRAPRVFIILCVDDEATPLTIRKLVLQKAGFHVITAGSAKDAQEILGTRNVDLVVSDRLMPEMTGAQLAAHVKRTHPTIPFMLLSGVNDLPDGAELADEFLSKLEGPETMIGRIRLLLANRPGYQDA